MITLEKSIHDVSWVHAHNIKELSHAIKILNFDIRINEKYHKIKKIVLEEYKEKLKEDNNVYPIICYQYVKIELFYMEFLVSPK